MKHSKFVLIFILNILYAFPTVSNAQSKNASLNMILQDYMKSSNSECINTRWYLTYEVIKNKWPGTEYKKPIFLTELAKFYEMQKLGWYKIKYTEKKDSFGFEGYLDVIPGDKLIESIKKCQKGEFVLSNQQTSAYVISSPREYSFGKIVNIDNFKINADEYAIVFFTFNSKLIDGTFGKVQCEIFDFPGCRFTAERKGRALYKLDIFNEKTPWILITRDIASLQSEFISENVNQEISRLKSGVR
jgi:hypothetical protein